MEPEALSAFTTYDGDDFGKPHLERQEVKPYSLVQTLFIGTSYSHTVFEHVKEASNYCLVEADKVVFYADKE